MRKYATRLSVLEYTELSVKEHAKYYLDFLSALWKPNLAVVPMTDCSTILVADLKDCPADFWDHKGACSKCPWFLGLEQLCNTKGCCGLMLHID